MLKFNANWLAAMSVAFFVASVIGASDQIKLSIAGIVSIFVANYFYYKGGKND